MKAYLVYIEYATGEQAIKKFSTLNVDYYVLCIMCSV